MKDPNVVKPMVIWSDANGWSLSCDYSDTLPEWQRMQKFVGGFIEHVPIVYNGRECSMFVHETGRFNFDTRNEWATQIYFTGLRLSGQDPEDPELRARAGEALAEKLGIPKENVTSLSDSDGKPEGIYGPVVLVDGFQEEFYAD